MDVHNVTIGVRGGLNFSYFSYAYYMKKTTIIGNMKRSEKLVAGDCN
jgi:hypothetical protein